MDRPERFPGQRYRLREEPLEPIGVVARGSVARRLARELLRWPEQSLSGARCLADLRAARVADGLFLLGESRSLPWVEGVQDLGRDPEAPELLLPTHAAPRLPLAWFRAAIARARPQRSSSGPIAVSFEPPQLVSLAEARALSREDLEHWCERFAVEPTP